MSKNGIQSARDLYLAALPPDDELTARRVAERSGIPDNDPTWLLLNEVRRACQETTRCTAELKLTASEAAGRIERASASVGGPQSKHDALAERIAVGIATKVANDERAIEAVASAVRRVEADATRAMRILETSIRDFVRRRAAAPIASIVFAFALGVTSCCVALWGTYHVALGYGQDLGYRAGFNDARTYDRSHR